VAGGDDVSLEKKWGKGARDEGRKRKKATTYQISDVRKPYIRAERGRFDEALEGKLHADGIAVFLLARHEVLVGPNRIQP
jgi:hypothetical protein